MRVWPWLVAGMILGGLLGFGGGVLIYRSDQGGRVQGRPGRGGGSAAGDTRAGQVIRTLVDKLGDDGSVSVGAGQGHGSAVALSDAAAAGFVREAGEGSDEGPGVMALGASQCPECKCPGADRVLDAREPTCPACRECPVCEAPELVCKPQIQRVAQLEQEVRNLSNQQTAVEKVPVREYDGPTSARRRQQAAEDNRMYLDFPSWDEDQQISAKVAANLDLTPEEKADIERMYAEFISGLSAKLRELLVELTGNTDAGANSSVNAMLHDILKLSPQGPCREALAMILSVNREGQSLNSPSVDASACEIAVYTLFTMVDQLEFEVEQKYGERGVKALWSSSASLSFSAKADSQ